MREIEICPDCYLHAHTLKDHWFLEPCVSNFAQLKQYFWFETNFCLNALVLEKSSRFGLGKIERLSILAWKSHAG